MATINFDPQTRQFNERKITRRQEGFGGGAYDDIPGSQIPENGVKYSKNYLLFKDRAEPRGGSKRWATTTLPALSGRTGYSLTKSGTTVTKTVGTDFSEEDIGSYIVYDDGKHEQITAYISTTQVTVDGTTAHAASTAAWMRGNYEYRFHFGKSKILLHIDTRLFVADDINISGWTECIRCGPYQLAKTKSIWEEHDDYMIIFNDNRIFKICLKDDPPQYYGLNTQTPTVKITNVAESPTLVYGYKYLYTMARIRGAGALGDRTTSGAIVELESGPTQPDDEDYRDYGMVYTSRPIGNSIGTYGVLTGVALPGAYDAVSEWAAVTDAQFRITIDGTAQNIGPIDFTGVVSWGQIADRIEQSLKSMFTSSLITCVWSVDHFVITSFNENGTVSVTSAGDGGTDIGATAMACQNASSVNNDSIYAIANTMGTLTLPLDPDDNSPIDHWTHYCIYRSLDQGANGIHPTKGLSNPSELFIWVGDVAIAKAFRGAVVDNEIVSADPIFTEADGEAIITFQDGTSVTATGYNSAISLSCTNADVAEQSARIGGGSMITASQSGTAITTDSGHNFVEGDVGKTIFWASGAKSVITGYTNAVMVTAYPSNTIAMSAATFDPVSRNYRDIVRDDYQGTDNNVKQLRTKAAGFSLRNRFWKALPKACNCGAISNGFLFAAERGKKEFYWSQMPEYQEYLAGYYNDYYQMAVLKDAVTIIRAFINNIAILCYHSMIGVPTNTFTAKKVEEVGEVVFVITGQYPIETEIGVKDWGSIQRKGRNMDVFLTTAPDFRVLQETNEGLVLSDNLSRDRIMKKLRLSSGISASSYDKINGYIVWIKNTTTALTAEETVWNDEFDANNNIYNDQFPEQDTVNNNF